MKTIKQVLVFFILSISVAKPQGIPINPGIFGQNAWFISNSNISTELDTLWPYIAASGVKYVRIGGADANFNPLYDFNSITFAINDVTKLVHLVDDMRVVHIEPIIQVGFNPVCGSLGTLGGVSDANQAHIAGNLVKYLNNPVSGTYKTNPIRYWILANEPDLYKNCVATNPRGYGWDGITSGASCTTPTSCANLIATYVKGFADSMKKADPTIKIIGPEIAKFGNDTSWCVNKIMAELISPTSNSNSIMGKTSTTGPYYIDYISFHYYPNYGGGARDTVIMDPTLAHDGFKNKLSSSGSYKGLVQMITSAGRNISNLKIACTEFNLSNADTIYDESVAAQYISMRNRAGNRSFISGQWMSNIFSQAMNTSAVNPITHLNESWVEFMNFWSVKESGVGACKDGKGYISNCSSTTHKYRSTYNHYKLLANHFIGNFYMASLGTTAGNIKAFAAKSCNGINIMILNQNDSTSTINSVRINLNGTMPTGSSTEAAIQFGTGSNKVAPTHDIRETINPEETLVIECDACGKPLSYWRYNKTASAPTQTHYAGWQKSCFCANGNLNNHTARCSNTDTTTVKHPTRIVNGTLEISDTMWVPNTIRVPNGATLTIKNANVVFSAGAQIYIDPPTTIRPGGQVIIMNSYLHGCDGANWAGITVTNQNDSGYVPLVIQQSTIHDALVAVHADSVTGMIITDSEISNGNTAMQLNHNKNFTLNNNSIEEYLTGIQTTNTIVGPSSISGNFISGASTAISMLNDNHSGLTIGCNDLYNYTSYGVRSINCTLKNQGSLLQGAGNIFTSSSLLLNNKFSHSGNSMNYYTDPSYPFTLVSGIGMNAHSILAQTDNTCSDTSNARASQASGTIKNSLPVKDKGIECSVFPNPFTNEFTVSYTLPPTCKSALVTITEIASGKEIIATPLPVNQDKLTLSKTEMKPGIYICRIITDDGTSKQIKVVHIK